MYRMARARQRISVVVALALITSVAGSGSNSSVSDVRGAEPPLRSPNEVALDRGPTVSLLATGAIISNGTVQLGVNQEGHLNVPGGTPSSQTGTTTVGIRYVPTNADSVSPGCECEGWGAADATSGTTGYANVSADGVVGLTLLSFTSTATTAASTVQIGTRLKVTHDFRPTPLTPRLYEVTVTVENISASDVDLRYRRVMDWDIEPTAFSEFVTTVTGPGAAVAYNNNDGFTTANPLGANTSGDPGVLPLLTGSFTDQGPRDHGAPFRLPPGHLTARSQEGLPDLLRRSGQ